MSLQRFLPIVILFLLPTLISQAQINEGTVIGTVQDAAGAAVPGAQGGGHKCSHQRSHFDHHKQ